MADELQRFERRGLIEVYRADFRKQRMIAHLEERHLQMRTRCPVGDWVQAAGRSRAALQLSEDFLRAYVDFAGNSGEARNVDALALIGGASHDSVEEHDLVFPLFDSHIEICDALQPSGQFRQFVVVGGKKSATPYFVMQVLHHRPRQ